MCDSEPCASSTGRKCLGHCKTIWMAHEILLAPTGLCTVMRLLAPVVMSSFSGSTAQSSICPIIVGGFRSRASCTNHLEIVDMWGGAVAARRDMLQSGLCGISMFRSRSRIGPHASRSQWESGCGGPDGGFIQSFAHSNHQGGRGQRTTSRLSWHFLLPASSFPLRFILTHPYDLKFLAHTTGRFAVRRFI